MTGKIKKISESVPVRSESPSPFQEIERRLRDMESRFENLFTDKWLQPSQWELPDWARMGALELKAPKVDIPGQDLDFLRQRMESLKGLPTPAWPDPSAMSQ